MEQSHIIEELNGAEHVLACQYDRDINDEIDYNTLTVLYCTSTDPTEQAQLIEIFKTIAE